MQAIRSAISEENPQLFSLVTNKTGIYKRFETILRARQVKEMCFASLRRDKKLDGLLSFAKQ